MFRDKVRRWLYRHRQASRPARFLNAAHARAPIGAFEPIAARYPVFRVTPAKEAAAR